jgi:hypothetical protein
MMEVIINPLDDLSTGWMQGKEERNLRVLMWATI